MPSRGRFKNIEAWPEPDCTLWRRGLSPPSLLDDTGHAAKWRPATVLKVSRAWAAFLNWLDATGQLAADRHPAHRLTPDRLDAYCAFLEGHVAATTVRSQLTDLARALSVMAPLADVRFVRQRSYRYPVRGDGLAKRARLVGSEYLLQLGFDLMAKADMETVPTRRDAVLFRDGLLIAVLACRAMRLKNLAALELGRQLAAHDARWVLRFEAGETKNHRLWLNVWPASLVPQLERYLGHYRPPLLRGRKDEGHLWISQRPGPMTDNGIYYAVIARTRNAFGNSINPHAFRDALSTSLAVDAPEMVRLSRFVLGHASYRTTEKFYNQARAIDASRKLNKAIARRRRRRPRKA